jgi:hypothetical protein
VSTRPRPTESSEAGGNEPRTFSARDAALLRRNRSYVAMGAAPLMVALATVVGALVTGTAGFLAATPHLFLLGILSLAYVLQQNPAPLRGAAGIRITPAGIWAGSTLALRREELKQGFVVPGGDEGVTVRLELRGRWFPVSLGVVDVATGEQILDALGLGAHQTASRVQVLGEITDWPVARQLAATVLPPVGGLLAGVLGILLTGSPLPFILLLVSTLVFTLVLGVARRSLDIGSEGLRFRWLGRETFLRFADVRSLEASDRLRGGKDFRVLHVVFRSGAVREITLAQKGWDGGLAGAVEERIRKAFEAYQRRESSDEDGTVAVLARRARDVGSWITTLKRIGAGIGEGPRDATIPRDALLTIVEDPSRADRDRAAAAVALGEGAERGERERVRVAAKVSASPRLRIALERAADEDVEQAAIEEALASLDDEESAERRDVGDATTTSTR